MLDPKLIKEKPQIIRDMLKARSVDFDLDELIELDQKRREFILIWHLQFQILFMNQFQLEQMKVLTKK